MIEKQFITSSTLTVGCIVRLFLSIEELADLAGKLHEREQFEKVWREVEEALKEMTELDSPICKPEPWELLSRLRNKVIKCSGGVLPLFDAESLCGILHFYGGYTLQSLYQCSLQEYGILWKGMPDYGKRC